MPNRVSIVLYLFESQLFHVQFDSNRKDEPMSCCLTNIRGRTMQQNFGKISGMTLSIFCYLFASNQKKLFSLPVLSLLVSLRTRSGGFFLAAQERSPSGLSWCCFRKLAVLYRVLLGRLCSLLRILPLECTLSHSCLLLPRFLPAFMPVSTEHNIFELF